MLEELKDLVNDLRVVHRRVSACFPRDFSIFPFFFQRYHLRTMHALMAHFPVQRLASPQLLLTAQWIQWYDRQLCALLTAPPAAFDPTGAGATGTGSGSSSSGGGAEASTLISASASVSSASASAASVKGASYADVQLELAVYMDAFMEQYVAVNKPRLISYVDACTQAGARLFRSTALPWFR